MAKSRLLMAALCALSLMAQEGTTPEDAASISGIVTNALTGDPVLHAHVVVRPAFLGETQQVQYGALSDGEGRFSITRIPAGGYLVTAEKTSFTQPSTPPQAVLFGKGDKKTGFKLTLVPCGVITGRVLDSNGDPMENARVMALGVGGSGVTDEEGRYRIGALTPGRVRVAASTNSMPLPAEHRTDGSEEMHHAGTFYPSSLTAEGAQWVRVRPGAETTGVDIQMVRVPVLHVSGRAIGVPEGAVPFVQLRTRSHWWSGSNGSPSIEPNGTFHIWRVNPGKYWLQVGASGGGATLQSAPLAIDLDSTSVENIEVRLLPPETIHGRVRWEGEAPRENTSRSMLIFSSVTGAVTFGPLPNVPIAEDGSFAVKNVPAGQYFVWHSGGGYVKSTRVGSRDSDGGMLDLSSGSGGEPIIVTLSTEVASLRGVVRKGGDLVAQGLAVVLVDQTVPASVHTRQGRTSSNGSYFMPGIPPGTYKLVVMALEEGTGGTAMFESMEGQEITFAPSENATRDLRYTPVVEQ